MPPGRGPVELEALSRAKARLDRLDLYDRPVRVGRVRILTAPALFRLPWFRRFVGYALPGTIVLRRPVDEVSDDLICHELCHVWQLQRRPLALLLAFVRHGYRANPFEIEARRAAADTRPRASAAPGPCGRMRPQGP